MSHKKKFYIWQRRVHAVWQYEITAVMPLQSEHILDPAYLSKFPKPGIKTRAQTLMLPVPFCYNHGYLLSFLLKNTQWVNWGLRSLELGRSYLIRRLFITSHDPWVFIYLVEMRMIVDDESVKMRARFGSRTNVNDLNLTRKISSEAVFNCYANNCHRPNIAKDPLIKNL